MFIVIEMQTNDGATAIIPPSTHTDINVAYQKYYTILAAAAISSVETHTVMLVNETGAVIRCETFAHAHETEVEE